MHRMTIGVGVAFGIGGGVLGAGLDMEVDVPGSRGLWIGTGVFLLFLGAGLAALGLGLAQRSVHSSLWQLLVAALFGLLCAVVLLAPRGEGEAAALGYDYSVIFRVAVAVLMWGGALLGAVGVLGSYVALPKSVRRVG